MKLILGNILILLIILTTGQSEPIRKENLFRISGGVTAAPITIGESGEIMKNDGQYPYIASLRKKLRVRTWFRCTAAIVKEDVILTAAHCTVGVHPTNLTVRAGSFTLKDVDDEHVQMRNVKEFINHPDHHKDALFNNDISIVWLEKPFELGKYVTPIKLARGDYAGETALFIGWGDNEKSEQPEFLLKADLRVMTQNDCIKAYRSIPERKVTDSMVCAIHRIMRQVVCGGDSGGPLILRRDGKSENDLLIGTTSWGVALAYKMVKGNKTVDVNKCEGSYPSVFARLDYLRPWIEQYVQLD